MIQTTELIVVVGASIDGTEALSIFLEAFPADSSGIVIVQHIPEHFTATFAQRLNELCKISVMEATNNDTVIRRWALIAHGIKKILLKHNGARYYMEVKDAPLVSHRRP
nr:chemotaxis protein CheB [Malonomonas rubra]